LTEKIDVFALGNVLYAMLMRKDVYEGMETEDVQKMVKKGNFLSIPKQKNVMKDAVAKAVGMCLVKDVEERSTAAEVESYLSNKLEEFAILKF